MIREGIFENCIEKYLAKTGSFGFFVCVRWCCTSSPSSTSSYPLFSTLLFLELSISRNLSNPNDICGLYLILETCWTCLGGQGIRRTVAPQNLPRRSTTQQCGLWRVKILELKTSTWAHKHIRRGSWFFFFCLISEDLQD